MRRGFALVKRNWKNAGLMWLDYDRPGAGWTIVAFIALILLIRRSSYSAWQDW